MRSFLRDPAGNIVALAIGLVIGLRTVQVVGDWRRLDDTFNFGPGVEIGFWVTLGFVFALAVWRRVAAPPGRAWPRLTSVGAGMLLGELVGTAFAAAL